MGENNNKFEYTYSAVTEKERKQVEEIRRLWAEIEEAGDCISLKTLAVNGGDLLAAGVERGKMFGELLSWLLDQVLEQPDLNQKEVLMEKLKERIQS